MISLHALARVPHAFQLPYVENLSDVIRVVRAHVSNQRGVLRQFLVVGGLNGLLSVA